MWFVVDYGASSCWRGGDARTNGYQYPVRRRSVIYTPTNLSQNITMASLLPTIDSDDENLPPVDDESSDEEVDASFEFGGILVGIGCFLVPGMLLTSHVTRTRRAKTEASHNKHHKGGRTRKLWIS